MCDRLSNVFVKAALFSGVVATFLALSIPDLQDQKGFHTSSFAVNILWLLSLVFSIGSAFFASKVQEWTETYQKTEYQTTGAQTTETHLIPEAHQNDQIRSESGNLSTPSQVLGVLDSLLGLLLCVIDCSYPRKYE